MVLDERVQSLESYRLKRAAKRGLREWTRLFQTVHPLNEGTRWADLPDWVILFLCEDSPESRLTVYDLLMGARGLGSGFEFETLPPERLMPLLDSYLLLMDQVRFECMRRLGWIDSFHWQSKSIIEQVFEASEIASPFAFPNPVMTPNHPAYGKVQGKNDLDYVTWLRKHIPDAVREFRRRQEPFKLKDDAKRSFERPED